MYSVFGVLTMDAPTNHDTIKFKSNIFNSLRLHRPLVPYKITYSTANFGRDGSYCYGFNKMKNMELILMKS